MEKGITDIYGKVTLPITNEGYTDEDGKVNVSGINVIVNDELGFIQNAHVVYLSLIHILFVKGDHKRQFAYEAHTACDKNGFILETVVTPGNVHDLSLIHIFMPCPFYSFFLCCETCRHQRESDSSLSDSNE